MMDILKTLVRWLDAGVPVASAVIAANEGSTPRAAGTWMIVREDGEMLGTVGGGLVEAEVLRAASGVFGQSVPRLMDFDLTGELAAKADMVCGGRLRVLLERIDPVRDASLFRELLDRAGRGERCLLVTPMDAGPRSLLASRGQLLGEPLPGSLLEEVLGVAESIRSPRPFSAEGRSWLVIPWSGPSPLYIAGAGHVARFTARVAAMAGFAVTVMDDRPEFANADRFPEACAILVKDLRSCLEGLPVGPDASVVILTRGHVHDAEVLAQALRTRAGYIGMIGSRRKRDSVYRWLGEKGFTDADFARVRCPIGLDIGAETPEEIAVCIVAELIQARAGRPGR